MRLRATNGNGFPSAAAGSKTRIVKEETFSRFQVSLFVKKFINRIARKSSAFVFRHAKGNPFRLSHDLTYSYEDYQHQLLEAAKDSHSHVSHLPLHSLS